MGKKEQNRQVQLFMDNAGVHNSAVENVPLKHNKVVFFPKNTTSCTQPLDAGIIQTFKLLYRKSLHNHVLYKLKQKFQNENSEDPYKTIIIALVKSLGFEGLESSTVEDYF